MTVKEILSSADFNNASISKEVFGNARTISDKEHNNRGKRWLDGDFERIAKYFEKKYKIICS